MEIRLRKLSKSAISAQVIGPTVLEPEERSHNETMGENDDGLIRVSQAQCLFKPANPLDEIGKALAARAPQGVTPLPIGRGSAV
jgi:hypothetical protein